MSLWTNVQSCRPNKRRKRTTSSWPLVSESNNKKMPRQKSSTSQPERPWESSCVLVPRSCAQAAPSFPHQTWNNQSSWVHQEVEWSTTSTGAEHGLHADIRGSGSSSKEEHRSCSRPCAQPSRVWGKGTFYILCHSWGSKQEYQPHNFPVERQRHDWPKGLKNNLHQHMA